MKNTNKNVNRKANYELYMSRRDWEQEYKAKYEMRLYRQFKRKVKKAVMSAIKGIAFACFMFAAVAVSGTSDFYEETGYITRNGIYLEDELGTFVRLQDGNEFSVFGYDYKPGTKVRLTLDANGTIDNYRDDVVIEVSRRIF